MGSKHVLFFFVLAATISPATAYAQWGGRHIGPPIPCPQIPGVRGDLVVLSMYGGRGAQVPYSLRGAEHETRAVSVRGNGTGPVTLVLAAYEPTVWDLSAIAGRVTAVVAHGHYPQAVSGLPSSIPVSFMSNRSADGRASENSRCGPINYAHEGMYKIQAQARHIQTLLGSHPRRWYGGYDPSAFNIDGGGTMPPGPPPASSVRAGVPVVTAGLMPGKDGLEQLVRAGVLRRFSKAEVDAWAARGGELRRTGRMATIIPEQHDPIEYIGTAHSGYLALRSVNAWPAGLGGADSAVFVVPEGVNVPYEAGHSMFYRLLNYPGIPPATGVVGPDSRAQMIQRSNDGYQPAAMFVEWDANGNVIRDGTRERPPRTPGEVPLIIEPPVAPTPVGPEPFANEADASRDMTPTALLTALLLAFGTAGMILTRRGAEWRGPHTKALPGREDIRALAVRDDVEEFHPEVSAALASLTEQLQKAIDASVDDDTAFTLLKFKRTIVRALGEPEYDDDLAQELDAIVERHLAKTIADYLRVVRRSSARTNEALEINLRESVQRLTSRVEEIINQQASRDGDRMREHAQFIRTRHPGATDLGASS